MIFPKISPMPPIIIDKYIIDRQVRSEGIAGHILIKMYVKRSRKGSIHSCQGKRTYFYCLDIQSQRFNCILHCHGLPELPPPFGIDDSHRQEAHQNGYYQHKIKYFTLVSRAIGPIANLGISVSPCVPPVISVRFIAKIRTISVNASVVSDR